MRWVWLLLAVLTGCAGGGRVPPLQRFEFTRLCMGVQTRIVTYAPSRERAVEAAAAAFSRIGELDAAMSDYQARSELNRVSDAAGGPEVWVSEELFLILHESAIVARDSGGAFDVTVGPVVRLWREARRTGVMPRPEEIERARKLVGFRGVVLDPGPKTVRLVRPGMRLDLGGIAKGLAAQRAVEAMRAHGLARSLVSLAGDVVAGDPPPGERGWRVALEGERSGRRIGVLLLARAAVSTSGDSEQFVEVGGERYSHIVDPRTGIGITARRAAAVVSELGEFADALATAACVLGPEASRGMIAKYPRTAAVFEEAGPDGLEQTVIDPEGILRWDQPPSGLVAARAPTR